MVACGFGGIYQQLVGQAPANVGAATDGQKAVVIHAGQLFDGKSDRLASNQVIVIEGERISEVGPTGSIKVPVGAEEIDLSKATVLPGLIEGHNHVFKWKTGVAENESTEYRTILAVLNAKTDLDAGFTTARDLMSYGGKYADIDVRRAINQGLIPGPRMLVATEGLVGTTNAPPGTRPIDSPWEGRKQVREIIKHGADLIKIFGGFTVFGPGGVMTAIPWLTLEEQEAIVDEAHRHGLKVACTSQGGVPLHDSIEAGCDSIELAVDLDPESVSKMAQKGIFVTFGLNTMKTKTLKEPVATEGRLNRAELSKLSFQRALKAGVKIAFGANAGTQGESLEHGKQGIEFETMVEYGMTPAQALRSATSVGAERIGWQDRVGSIEKNKYADFIAVSGNPLQDITELQRVKFVMKGGKIVRNEIK